MDLLKQCQQWFEQDETQKVMDALEAIPAGERTPRAGQRAGQGIHRHCRDRRGRTGAV